METIKVEESDSVKYLIEQRNVLLEFLNDTIKLNDNTTEMVSLEVLKDIIKINSQIKLDMVRSIFSSFIENKTT